MAEASRVAVRIERILARLPESQRTAFQLIKQEGLSVAEAAAVLGTTVAAVKLRAHRAYEALRVVVGDAGAAGSVEPIESGGPGQRATREAGREAGEKLGIQGAKP